MSDESTKVCPSTGAACPSGGSCESCSANSQNQEELRLQENLAKIDRSIVVISGKGGVGKSTVAVNLALTLATEGKRVGLLDVDVHGPSVPKMLHLENAEASLNDAGKLLPVEIGTLKVLSIGFFLETPDAAVVWRGPVKIGVIRQFLADAEWGELDFLVVDAPPGTGDEPLTVCQVLGNEKTQALIVTSPQDVAAADVARSLTFCRELGLPVAGIVENFSGFVCPHCGKLTEIFPGGAGEKLAAEYGVPLLAKLPIDPAICRGGDAGAPFSRTSTTAAKIFGAMAAKFL